MSTKESLELNEITSGNPLLSSIRSIVETTFTVIMFMKF